VVPARPPHDLLHPFISGVLRDSSFLEASFLVRKLKKEENLKEKLFTKKEGLHCIIPKKIADTFLRRSISQEVGIRGSEFSEEICTLIPLSKCVM
jgi:hypothetical protein